MAMVALVGMSGAGKTEAARFFLKAGFEEVYFGGIVLDEVKKRGLPLKEEFERPVREELRKKHGMAAMALLSIPKIEKLLAQKKNVLIEDLYSWQELLVLRERFPEIKLIAVFASPAVRYKRVAKRPVRPLAEKEARERDKEEIEKLDKGGPIAVADYTIINEGTKKELEAAVKKILKKI